MKKIFASTFFLLIAFSFSASAQSITKIYLSLDTASNTGKCPRVLKFKAVLLTDRHPGTATIKWLNANGSLLHTSNVSLTASGQDIAIFELAVPTKTTGAVSVVTTAAKPAQSNEVQYTVTCK